MNLKVFLTIFITIFLAELGDKTQLATLLFAADRQINKLGVFCVAALALIISTALGVAAGGSVAHYINRRTLSIIAGAGFVLVGLWTIAQGINMEKL